MIQVSDRTPARLDADKARKITAAGDSVMFTGNPRHLRRMMQLLTDDTSVDAFLGNDDNGAPVLIVDAADAPGEARGAFLTDRVPSAS